ncbi:MAG: polymer-forming cytoskeletal protein [Verrucomicrobiaceae bacterium]
MEPPLAVSTYCRECSAHFKIENGKAVSHNKKEVYNPFANRPTPVQKNSEVVEETKKDSTSDSAPPQAAAPPSFFKPKKKAITADDTRTSGLFGRTKRQPRKIRCFDCKAEHTISPNSTSALCPKCGSYISLKDYEIRERWNRRIQTRGDVFIHKKGVVAGTTIQCHHLTVEGDFTGGVECSGDLVIRRNGKIMGKVVCRRLIVEKRATLEFLNSVETEECSLDGVVTGNIACSGLLRLEKKALLNGNVRVGRLAIEEGARHHGQIQMGG